jgi:proteasome lid subunit RPN8/RPN11
VSRLLLTPRHRKAIDQNAATAYPEECCGVLVGRPLEDGVRLVEQVLPARNERSESRHNRYVIPPQAVLAAERAAREKRLEVLGYYHSHPDHPAVPSAFDRDNAWPGVSYLIVAVESGRPAAARSWRLTADRERFEEEEVGEPGGSLRPFPALSKLQGAPRR